MGRLLLGDLPKPKLANRIDRQTRRSDGELAILSRARAQAEDKTRIKALGRTSGLSPDEAVMAEDLRNRMKRAVDVGKVPETLASSDTHRKEIIPILSHLWKLIEENPYLPIAMVTFRPRRMLVETDDLLEKSPFKLKRQLRNHLDRAGVTQTPGFLLAGLDAEFDANRGNNGVFDFHFHGIAGGEKIAALEGLREFEPYDNARIDPLEQDMKESCRLKIQEELVDMPTPLVYSLKSWFPHRPTFLQPDGTRDRSERKQRMPNPYLQLWLMWMDKWAIDDLVLTNGLEVTKYGFRIRS